MKTIKREIEILSKIDNPYIVKYEFLLFQLECIMQQKQQEIIIYFQNIVMEEI